MPAAVARQDDQGGELLTDDSVSDEKKRKRQEEAGDAPSRDRPRQRSRIAPPLMILPDGKPRFCFGENQSS